MGSHGRGRMSGMRLQILAKTRYLPTVERLSRALGFAPLRILMSSKLRQRASTYPHAHAHTRSSLRPNPGPGIRVKPTSLTAWCRAGVLAETRTFRKWQLEVLLVQKSSCPPARKHTCIHSYMHAHMSIDTYRHTRTHRRSQAHAEETWKTSLPVRR